VVSVTATKDLACQELVEIITDYLEGIMPLEEQIRFDRHVGSCGGCATYLIQMQCAIRVVERLRPVPKVGREKWQHLLHAFRGIKDRG
jgi:hypothetical protein